MLAIFQETSPRPIPSRHWQSYVDGEDQQLAFGLVNGTSSLDRRYWIFLEPDQKTTVPEQQNMLEASLNSRHSRAGGFDTPDELTHEEQV